MGTQFTISFRAKLLLLASLSVLFALALSSTVALQNLSMLGSNSHQKIQQGLTDANHEYLRNYIDTTSQRITIMLNGGFSELAMLAGVAQSLIDHPRESRVIAEAIAKQPRFKTQFARTPGVKWVQNQPNDASVISVWGPLVGKDGLPKPETMRHIASTEVLDHVLPAIRNYGSNKLYAYLVGPHGRSYLRLAPYLDMASEFDKAYPGSTNSDFWDFFFPGFVADWQALADSAPPRDALTRAFAVTPLYEDAAGGGLIVSAFHPLWTDDYKKFGGAVAIDIALGQMVQLIENVKLARTGFAFLAQSDGNILAISRDGERTLDLRSSVSSKGTSNLERYLGASGQPDVAGLELPVADDEARFHRIGLAEDSGAREPYLVVTKRLQAFPQWSEGQGIRQNYWSLGFVVPEHEILATLREAQGQLQATIGNTLYSQILVGGVSLVTIFLAVWWFSRRMTAGLIDLTHAAAQLSSNRYGTRVTVRSRDEIGQLGTVFNDMSAEIERYTTRLEDLVAERTRELEKASQEIVLLNERLKQENVRLGSEVEVARRMQMMVLPRSGELQAVRQLDIATFMEPAEEVGGDYYDVLQHRDGVKIGIGDVTGHGLESGVLMLMVQSVARALQEQGASEPTELLGVLNRVIYKNIVRTQSDKYLTLSFADLRPDGEVILSGQHEEVVIVRKTGAVERIDTSDLGFPVGLEPDIADFVTTRSVQLGSGDILILHTDGITEAENPVGELYGIERLCESAARHASGTAEAIKTGIIADLMAHIANQKIYDDITLVVAKQR